MMNKQILENLFEFWHYTGKQTGQLIHEADFKSISLKSSDWPNRVFGLSEEKAKYDSLIARIKQNEFPNLITLPESFSQLEVLKELGLRLLFKQKGMSILLQENPAPTEGENSFKQVASYDDAVIFARIASESFQYRVNPDMIQAVAGDPKKVKLFLGKDHHTFASCGLIFFNLF